MKASYTCTFDLQQNSIIHLSMLIWRGWAGKDWGFDKGSRLAVRTFDHRQVSGVGNLNFL